jgi:DNA replication and repair protein RecF
MSVARPALVCHTLRLRDFRNFAAQDLEFPAAGVAVIGLNGSGKTNLLEAIYYLEIFRSQRGSPDEQLVRFGAEAFHVRGHFADPASAQTAEVTAAYEARSRTKRVTLDGVLPDRLGDAVGRVRAVVFSPSDIAIVAGPPAGRRRFLDIVLSVNEPGHLAALQRYRHLLRQRNAILKAGGAASVLAAWDTGLIETGSRILYDRAQWIGQWSAEFERRACRVGGGPGPRIAYRPGVPMEERASLEQTREGFAAALERLQPRERDRRVTLAGPHRDDVAIVTASPDGDVDLRDYGSAGQMRTAAIALRMIEAETARQRSGAPILLLDDVFAELDAVRTRRILELLEEEGHGQVLLTVPKESDLDVAGGGGFLAALPRWHIEAGRIRA